MHSIHDDYPAYSTLATSNVSMWEILVPTTKHPFHAMKHGVVNWGAECIPCKFADHMAFDNFVKVLTGGLTIYPVGKGKWDDEEGRQYHEMVIPVRIACTRSQFEKILEFAVNHYRQKEVLGYRISDEVIFHKHGDMR